MSYNWKMTLKCLQIQTNIKKDERLMSDFYQLFLIYYLIFFENLSFKFCFPSQSVEFPICIGTITFISIKCLKCLRCLFFIFYLFIYLFICVFSPLINIETIFVKLYCKRKKDGFFWQNLWKLFINFEKTKIFLTLAGRRELSFSLKERFLFTHL